MPYPEQHQLISVIGDAYSARERWQFGLRLTDGGVSNQATADAIADDVLAWWNENTVDDSQAPPSSHRLVEVKVARIDVNGTYPPAEASASHFYLPPVVGLNNPLAGAIPQGTVVASLMTALPRGLASKGRIYLPPSARATIGATDGLMTAAAAQNLADATWNLIKAINANTVVGNVAIYSRGKGVPTYDSQNNRIEYTYPNPGASNVVTGVRVGRVVDTQRRRRRQLAEEYVVDST